MKICFITWSIKLTTIYKFLSLKDKLKDKNIELDIFITNKKLFDIIHTLSNFYDKEYKDYLNKIKIIKLCNNNINFLKYDQVILSIDYNFEKKMNDNGRLNLKLDPQKTYTYKYRICNDLYPFQSFVDHCNQIIIPSKIYFHNCLLFDYCLNLNKNNLPQFDFVQPIEICDKKNNFLNLKKENIFKKYNLDESKKCILYSETIISKKNKNKYNNNFTENLLRKKILENKELNEKYNILIHSNPYVFEKYNTNNKLIEFVDYEFIINNCIDCLIGGLSTNIRESLIYEKPVLNIYPNFYKGKELQNLLNDRYNGQVNREDEYEGVETSVEDNWIDKIEKLLNSKFSYKEKRDIWFSGKEIENKIYNLLSLPKKCTE